MGDQFQNHLMSSDSWDLPLAIQDESFSIEEKIDFKKTLPPPIFFQAVTYLYVVLLYRRIRHNVAGRP